MTNSSSANGLRYDTVFLDVDGTLLWVDLDIEGYVRDLAPYAPDGGLTVERAAGPLRESVRTHIAENIKYRTAGALNEFRRRNALATARRLGVEAPPEVITGAAERRISFRPYPESEEVLRELRGLGARLYVVSNWDVLLEEVLRDLGWRGYFQGVVASAAVGREKPDPGIFEEALRRSGASRGRTVHVGNDPVADVEGARAAGIDAVLVDRRGGGGHPEAAFVVSDLREVPGIVRGES
ncbi:HAD-superfamily hydrolase subfamily IA, variant 3 [Rubrobacter xylanophilus DSM 9941]|uniref:HAD-superfamily hydrolase subfamily IA, variant 3 n=1 Tax=Rubrobacter xylanophilus (strain DSM 9941 / JCM 11954 / NBRC 16129 / PRD-1) TaxID=266117 RepID=Q1AWU2_RUBXD|nr:HAD family hydrolase [Rubrobacter xylanophilus]ABG04136.1 HAD-superfamily hydrolase subfamily IA, variant 3 [Rubrobacter xylanophilus DSM 9941]